MKKFLSLVLALVMTMSLVTISAGAKDFTDDESITYAEAIDVMSAVKVIDGYTDGAFKPTTQLNRGQAAKILCNMILGPTTASALKADAAPFKDVAADNTFAGYIAYCAQAGIIDGYTDGTFRPTAPLTGYAFMKLLLGALGYDKDVEGYNAPNWSINVAKQALGIGLDDGLTSDFDGTKIVTREEACLFALNAMKATMVEYGSKTTVSVGGADVIIAGSKAQDVANTSKNDGNIKDDNKMQFAEKYFTNLKKVGSSDSFDRPATTWKIKSETIGTYTNTPDLTYTTSVKLGDIYADLGLSSAVPYTKVTTLEDGVVYQKSGKTVSYAISKGDAQKVGGDGVITEIFYDDDNDSATISMIHVYAGKVTATHKATSNKDAYITVAPKWTGNSGKAGNFETEDTYAVDDVVLYSYSMKSGEGVQDVRPAETKSGTLTGYTVNSKVVVAGETVKANETIKTQITEAELGLAKSYDVTLVLDENGYVVYVDTDNAMSNYAVVLKISPLAGDFNTSTKAELLFTDGTTATVSAKAGIRTGSTAYAVADNKSGVDISSDGAQYTINAGDIVRYTVNNKDEYTLYLVADKSLAAGDGTNARTLVTNGNSDLSVMNANLYDGSSAWEITGSNSIYANGKTTFLVATQGHDGKIYTVYTGIKNVPTLKTNVATSSTYKTPYTVFCKEGHLAKVVYVDLAIGAGSVNSNSKDTVILLATSNSKTSYNDGNGTYYLYDALVNGKLVEDYKVSNSTAVSSFGLGKYPMYTNATVSEDVYTLSGSANANGVYYGKGTKAAKEGVVGLGTVTASGLPYGDHIPYADDVEVFVIDDNGDLTSETSLGIGAVVDSDVNEVVFKVTDYEVTTILVIEPAASKSGDQVLTQGIQIIDADSAGDYQNATFYMADGTALSQADMRAALIAHMKKAGCENISFDGDTLRYTYAGVLVKTTNTTQKQVYKVTYKAVTAPGGAADANWTVTGAPEYIAVGDTLTITISHSGWSSGGRYVALGGAATAAKIDSAVTPTSKAASVTTKAITAAADGVVEVIITNS